MKKLKSKTPQVRLVTTYSVNDTVRAELIKNTLLDHRIECELDGENQAGFTGALQIGILVREPDASLAAEIIKIHFPESN